MFEIISKCIHIIKNKMLKLLELFCEMQLKNKNDQHHCTQYKTNVCVYEQEGKNVLMKCINLSKLDNIKTLNYN
jgi:hypothetical protein